MKNGKNKKIVCRVKGCPNGWHKTSRCPNVPFSASQRGVAPLKIKTTTKGVGDNVVLLDDYRKAKQGEDKSTLLVSFINSSFNHVVREVLSEGEKLVVEFKKDNRNRWILSRKATTFITPRKSQIGAGVSKKEQVVVRHKRFNPEKVWAEVDKAGARAVSVLNHPSSRRLIPSSARRVIFSFSNGEINHTFR